MPCLAASCAVVSSPRNASSATFALNSAEYRVRLPVIRVHPSHRRTELTHLSEIRGPPHTACLNPLLPCPLPAALLPVGVFPIFSGGFIFWCEEWWKGFNRGRKGS